MLLLNTDYITNQEFTTLSLVQGSTVHSKNVGKDLLAGFKSVVGGELKAYTEMLAEARSVATQRMISQAEQLGADAIVNVRFSSSDIMQGAAEILVVGTAVKFK